MTTAAHFLELLIDDNPKHFVEGESDVPDFVNRIDIIDWNWDVKDPAAQSSGTCATAKGAAAKGATGASAGGDTNSKIQPSFFSFEKYVDRSTTSLMSALHNGTKFKKARFTLREELRGVRLGPHGQFKLVVTLEGDVVLLNCSVTLTASEFEVDLKESWELRYHTVMFELGEGTGDYRSAQFDLPPGSEAGASSKPPGTLKDQLERMNPKELAAVLAALPKKGS